MSSRIDAILKNQFRHVSLADSGTRSGVKLPETTKIFNLKHIKLIVLQKISDLNLHCFKDFILILSTYLVVAQACSHPLECTELYSRFCHRQGALEWRMVVNTYKHSSKPYNTKNFEFAKASDRTYQMYPIYQWSRQIC